MKGLTLTALPMGLLLVVGLFSCKNSLQHEVVQPVTQEPIEISDTTIIPLKLDNGYKWKADVNTIRAFAKMLDEVHSFDWQLSDTTNQQAYDSLAGRLTGDVNALYSNCKMTGQGYEELHKLLAQVNDSIGMMETGDIKARKKGLDRTHYLLESYSRYFD